MEMHFTPAEWVIREWGTAANVARALGISRSAVCIWQRSRKWPNSKGAIPVGSQLLVLEAARRDGKDITADDLLRGRTVSGKLRELKAVSGLNN